jgi:hypothetical protein
VRRDDKARHELGNALGIVLANLEGMIDGLVTPTNERLEAIADAVRRSQALLNRMDEEMRER